jgi:AbrB family looped-hinge helix DNA binding protein
MKMTYKTKISKGFQTVVPAEIRKKFKVGPGDQLEWILSDGEVKLKFRKKVSLDDVLGIIDVHETDAVELKRRLQRGDKI